MRARGRPAGQSPGDLRLLAHDGGSESVLRIDLVVTAVRADLEADPVDGPGEVTVLRRVVVADRGAVVLAEVGGLVQGEDHGDRGVEAALTDLCAVEEQGDAGALAESVAVVGEVHADLVPPRGQLGLPADGVSAHAEQVVAVPGGAVLDVQAPSAEGTALGDDDSVREPL